MTAPEHHSTPIRDAACIILTDHLSGETRLLLGRRRATQVFLPNKWVFPGGRVDPEDHSLAATVDAGSLTPGSARRLPFVAAAVRELYEEAGLLFAPDGPGDGPCATAPSINSGRVGLACRALIPVARAITPPGLPRRFDTWFFRATRAQAIELSDPDGELLELGWFSLTDARALDLPSITRHIVEDVAASLTRGPGAAEGPFPFYFQKEGRFHRELLNDTDPPAQP